ncbi:hypothetical protein GCM10007047_15950 [Cerasicoccus arenae]|uniref:HTH lacI-type domain-containing protein n=2 Tax=Cerasicoccus arenae TaxID=424488 RepID=A0A8J3DBC3_9BACT|nr:hypothetical protein GCM10007047_15950 [Cerasicoccus arenae]
MQDIAKLLNVSKMTVSLALRNHPSIPEATRTLVEDKANELGYQRNQELSKYMAAMRRDRSESNKLPIAYITTGETPDTWKKSHTQVLYRKGAHEQADAYGYYLDEFWIDEPGMTAQRLSKILWSRGIHGVLVHPFNRRIDPELAACSLSLDWDQFSTVVMSDTLLRPVLNRVIHAHYESMMTTMNRLVELGYRRIGYCMSEQNDLVTNRRWHAAYLVYLQTHQVSGLAPIPSLVEPEIDQHLLKKWLDKHRIDAFVSASPNILNTVQPLGLKLGQDIAYADLDLDMQSPSHAGISGIDQNSLHFGHAAVDLVINGILKNEHGLPQNPMTMQIEGAWCDRGTTPSKK